MTPFFHLRRPWSCRPRGILRSGVFTAAVGDDTFQNRPHFGGGFFRDYLAHHLEIPKVFTMFPRHPAGAMPAVAYRDSRR